MSPKLTKNGQLMVRIVRGVRRLLKKGWIKGAYAKDEDFVTVFYKSNKAVCFCLEGALRRECARLGLEAGDWRDVYLKSLGLFVAARGFRSPVGFNDDLRTTKNDVMDVLGEAERYLIKTYRAR